MVRATRVINGASANAAREEGAIYLSTTPYFDGHRLCDGNSSNDWFVPFRARAPQAGHPRYWGHQAEGVLLDWCVNNLASCAAYSSSNTPSAPGATVPNLGVGSLGGVPIENDNQTPGTPVAAPTGFATRVRPDGMTVDFSWAPVSGGETYEVRWLHDGGEDLVAETDGTTTASVTGVPAGPQCFDVTVQSGDEYESVGSTPSCVTLRPNSAPTAIDGAMGMRAGMTHSRSVASLASDPDKDPLTYELVEIGFSASTFKFSWNSATGGFTMTVPAGNGGQSYLKFRVRDSYGAVSRVAYVKLDFVV
jgi:hypothetical protein